MFSLLLLIEETRENLRFVAFDLDDSGEAICFGACSEGWFCNDVFDLIYSVIISSSSIVFLSYVSFISDELYYYFTNWLFWWCFDTLLKGAYVKVLLCNVYFLALIFLDYFCNLRFFITFFWFAFGIVDLFIQVLLLIDIVEEAIFLDLLFENLRRFGVFFVV